MRKGSIQPVLFLVIAVATLPATVLAADDKEYTVVLRADSPDRKVVKENLSVRVAGYAGQIIALQDASEVPTTIALVLDAGPDQTKVFKREKELASGVINTLSGPNVDFILIRAGHRIAEPTTTSDRSAAIHAIETLTTDEGAKSGIPIYNSIALAIRELSIRPGIRTLITIAEGNDSGSRVGFKELRGLAESNHVACLSALVDDHSTRGSKSILIYGWSLQDLAGYRRHVRREWQEDRAHDTPVYSAYQVAPPLTIQDR